MHRNYFNANTTTPQQPAPSTEPYNVVYNSLYNAYSKYPGGVEAPNEYTVPIINKHMKTENWAIKNNNNEPIFLKEPECPRCKWHIV